MKKIALGTIVLALAAGTAAAQDVRMGTEGAYPPYNFVNDDGEIDGFERKLGDELCARAGLTCTWVKNDWDSIIPNLVSGNYDTIIAGMSITAERDEVIDFTQEYLPPDPSAFAAMAGNTPDLEGGVIAAQSATIQASFVASSGATLVEFATPDEAVNAVRNGEADAVLADTAFLAEMVDAGDMEFVGDPVYIGGGVGMGLRESDADLKAKFDDAICSMKKDGSLAKLVAEYPELPQGKPADC